MVTKAVAVDTYTIHTIICAFESRDLNVAFAREKPEEVTIVEIREQLRVGLVRL